jgi:hypothetical protein
MISDLQTHPLARIFPSMSAEEFAGFKADIAARGVLEAVWLYEGQILDGRHRARACRELGVPYATRDYEGDDPLGFIIAMNLHRRHLNESQRAMVAATLANMTVGRPPASDNSLNLGNKPMSQSQAAEILNVSPALVSQAVKVRREAAPELVEAVEHGRLKVYTVYQALQEEKPEPMIESPTVEPEPGDDWELTPGEGEEPEGVERPAWENYQKTLTDVLDDLLMVLDGFERHGGIAVVTQRWPSPQIWRYWQQLEAFKRYWDQLCGEFRAVCETVTVPVSESGGQAYGETRGPTGIQPTRPGDLPGVDGRQSSEL